MLGFKQCEKACTEDEKKKKIEARYNRTFPGKLGEEETSNKSTHGIIRNRVPENWWS